MPDIIEEQEIDSLTFSKNVKPVVNKSRHYIDDDHLTGILSVWKKEFDTNKAAGLERPRLPEAVGEAICNMAESMGKRHNFHDYSYLEEMKSDGILHCVKYIHNFNPEKKSEKKGKVSAFGYINMILWRCFTHRIKSEKLEQYLKYKSFELMGGMDAFQDEDMMVASGDSEESSMSVSALGADFINKAREYEQQNDLDKVTKKKEKKVVFDNFMFLLDEPVDTFGTDEEEELEIEFE